jgi:hypothetical protein
MMAGSWLACCYARAQLSVRCCAAKHFREARDDPSLRLSWKKEYVLIYVLDPCYSDPSHMSRLLREVDTKEVLTP